MARRPTTIQYNGKTFRSPLEVRWAVALDLLKIPYEPAPVRVMLPDGRSFIPSFLLPSMKCYFDVLPKAPTVQERNGLEWLAEITLRNRTFEHVHVSYGDIGQSRIEPVFGHTVHKMTEKSKNTDEPEEDYGEILAQCSFCGRFSFARAGSCQEF